MDLYRTEDCRRIQRMLQKAGIGFLNGEKGETLQKDSHF